MPKLLLRIVTVLLVPAIAFGDLAPQTQHVTPQKFAKSHVFHMRREVLYGSQALAQATLSGSPEARGIIHKSQFFSVLARMRLPFPILHKIQAGSDAGTIQGADDIGNILTNVFRWSEERAGDFVARFETALKELTHEATPPTAGKRTEPPEHPQAENKYFRIVAPNLPIHDLVVTLTATQSFESGTKAIVVLPGGQKRLVPIDLLKPFNEPTQPDSPPQKIRPKESPRATSTPPALLSGPAKLFAETEPLLLPEPKQTPASTSRLTEVKTALEDFVAQFPSATAIGPIQALQKGMAISEVALRVIERQMTRTRERAAKDSHPSPLFETTALAHAAGSSQLEILRADWLTYRRDHPRSPSIAAGEALARGETLSNGALKVIKRHIAHQTEIAARKAARRAERQAA
jgi:hypothetical protein